MRTNDIPAGARIGIDSNVFIHHFCGRSRQCTRLLARVERGELHAATTREVMHEVLHRLMVLEAVQAGAIKGRNPARALKAKPESVRALHRYFRDTKAILAIGIRLLPALDDAIDASQRFRTRYGLLTNDSILAATLKDAGVDILVTADVDFSRIKELSVVMVDDLPVL